MLFKTSSFTTKLEQGSLLIEGLVAMMIFSVGIVGLINLQAFAVKAAAEATYRSEAAMLANDLIGKMWSSDRTPAVLQTEYQSPSGTAFRTWAWQGAAGTGTATAPASGTVYSILPGASANPPTVAFNVIPPVVAGNPSISQVTITIFWKSPSDKATDPVNNYVALVQIGG